MLRDWPNAPRVTTRTFQADSRGAVSITICCATIQFSSTKLPVEPPVMRVASSHSLYPLALTLTALSKSTGSSWSLDHINRRKVKTKRLSSMVNRFRLYWCLVWRHLQVIGKLWWNWFQGIVTTIITTSASQALARLGAIVIIEGLFYWSRAWR